jgi:hypothetical protein
MNEAARVEEIAPCTAPKSFDSEEQERAIESVARLLSSGRPLSEILQTVKLIASRDQPAQPDAFSERVPDTLHTPAESHTHSLEGESTEFPEPANAALADNQLGAGVPASSVSDDAVIALDVSAGQQLRQLTSIRRPQHVGFSGLFGAALFWLIPTLSLAVVTIAGKSLIEAGVVEIHPDAAARAIIGVARLGEHQAILPGTEANPAAAKSLVAQPGGPELRTAQPDLAEFHMSQPATAEPESAQPDRSETPSVQPDPVGPQLAKLDHAESQTVQPERSEARLTAEQIRALLDRGDAFVSMADMNAARLSYERAAAAGNADAAVRLGATFDPAFLGQAGLTNVRGDVNAAEYWYRRARDLESYQSQPPLQGTEVARASEHVVTGTTAEPAIPNGQGRIQTPDRAPAKIGAANVPGLRSQTRRRPSPLPERHIRDHRSTNGPRCPHVGHCLTPP